MGTFHDNLGELHGITVAVETAHQQMIVGRCHEANDHHVIILDADVHEEGDDAVTNADWLRRAAKWGVFPKHKVLKLERVNVASITRLNELPT
ncbi:MAG: hypothetical protein WD294_10390 [Phycisphaeraceae bacterium]